MTGVPSLTFVVQHAREALRRFPLVFACAVLSAVVAISLVETDSTNFAFIKILMTLGMGIPLFFSLNLYVEKPIQSFRPPSLLLSGVGILVLLGFYFLTGKVATDNFFLNLALWVLALHLLAAFSPFLGAGEVRGFWQFNRTLFLRFFFSAIYAAVFFLGLISALGAVGYLFAVKIHDKLYFDIWLVSTFVLMTWHFLAGIPRQLSELENDDSYPGGLKIFTQYLLVPLVTLYLIILYVYLGKILLTANWPKGTVTWLVSLVSVFGVFNLLLLQPVQEKPENRWIRVYARSFYIALFPLLGMLFTAVGKRIGQYGVTEPRYFVTVLGVWILCIALYFLLHKKPSIKAVPMTLFVIIVATSLGPWSAYSVSRVSQMNRLKTLFVKDGLWNGARAVKAANPVPLEDRKEISSILDYMVQNHGVAPLQPWFDLDLSKWKDEEARSRYGYSSVSNEICKSIGFDHVNQAGRTFLGENFSYESNDEGGVLSLKGYDWMVPIGFNSEFKMEGKDFTVTIAQGDLVVSAAGEPNLVFNLAKILEGLDRPSNDGRHEKVPAEKLSLEASNDRWVGRLYLRSLFGYRSEEGLSGVDPRGFLFLKHAQ